MTYDRDARLMDEGSGVEIRVLGPVELRDEDGRVAELSPQLRRLLD